MAAHDPSSDPCRPRKGWGLLGDTMAEDDEETTVSMIPLTENDSDDINDSSDFTNERSTNLKKLIEYQGNHRLKILLALGLAVVGVGVAVALGLIAGLLGRHESLPSNPYLRAQALLSKFPVADGHNDFAFQLRLLFQNKLSMIDLRVNTSGRYNEAWQTDIPRLRAGKVGIQFWSAYMPCEPQYQDITRLYVEQIDIIKRFVTNRNYSMYFSFATSTADIATALAQGRIASLIGIEGGNAIDNSLAILRQMYYLGARYMTLTHNCNTEWAESCCDSEPLEEGLTEFGVHVVKEMNRLGMMVDISHVSAKVMNKVLDVTEAPVIFSHSSARALCNVTRNVPDSVLRRMPINGGIVMVNFYSLFINCSEYSSLAQVADHIDYIKNITGVNHVGIGSDFDGISFTPTGLSDVSMFPNLFAELIRRGYSDDEIGLIANGNLLRVFQEVEKVSSAQQMIRSPDDMFGDPMPRNSSCSENN